MTEITIESASEAERKRWELMRAGNAEALGSLLSEALQYSHSDSSADTRQSYLEKLANGDLVYDELDCSIQEAAQDGGAVVILGRMQAQIRLGGRPVTLDNSYLTVWVDGARGPLLLAHKSTPMRHD